MVRWWGMGIGYRVKGIGYRVQRKRVKFAKRALQKFLGYTLAVVQMIGSSTGKFLVLTGSEDRHQGLIDWLKSQHEVIVAHSLAAALAAMRDGSVEAVFSDAGDFLPLERALASQQSGVILDTIGEG